jgi:hypothetical protein
MPLFWRVSCLLAEAASRSVLQNVNLSLLTIFIRWVEFLFSRCKSSLCLLDTVLYWISVESTFSQSVLWVAFYFHFFILFFFVCVVLGLELRAYTLSHSASPPFFVMVIFEIGSLQLFDQHLAGLQSCKADTPPLQPCHQPFLCWLFLR